MTRVNHKSIILETNYGITIGTLCGRISRQTNDGYMNVSDNITCKHCIKAMKTAWGKVKIKQSIRG